MTDDKRAKRLSRYMRLLAKRDAVLRDTASAETVLLEFAGDRSVRCARVDLDAMQRADLVAVKQDGALRRVVLSSAGLAALRRGSIDGHAQHHRQMRRTDISMNGSAVHVTVNDAESPLAALARMRRPDGLPWLGKEETAAGERLRADFERAMLQPRITASWDFSHTASGQKTARNGAAELSDGAIAARGRVNAAVEAVGPELGGALVDICCFLKGLEQVERERGWPRRSAKLMIKTALAMLDRHYHPEPRPERRTRHVLHWGADGFRPSLSAG